MMHSHQFLDIARESGQLAKGSRANWPPAQLLKPDSPEHTPVTQHHTAGASVSTLINEITKVTYIPHRCMQEFKTTVPALMRLKQGDCCEFKDDLGHPMSFKTVSAIE